jgi:hypothetical protein
MIALPAFLYLDRFRDLLQSFGIVTTMCGIVMYFVGRTGSKLDSLANKIAKIKGTDIDSIESVSHFSLHDAMKELSRAGDLHIISGNPRFLRVIRQIIDQLQEATSRNRLELIICDVPEVKDGRR